MQGYKKKTLAESKTLEIYNQQMKQPSDSLKGYKIVKSLGHGTFATVSMIARLTDNVHFALKSIQTSKMNQRQLEYALNEVRLLSSISIPNVIKYQGTYFNENTAELGIIMEYADGGDLQQKINLSKGLGMHVGFDEEFIWKLAFQMLRGLKKLHEHKIIHRDIKTANIFFVNGVAKLGDLNVSRVAQHDFCSTLTGTPYYMSPEIWRGQRYNQKCDIWSLGCVLYQMCTFQPPFRAKDIPTLLKKVTQGQYADISSIYSEKLRRLIGKCLNPRPQARPNARDLLRISLLRSHDFPESENEGFISLIDPIRAPQKVNHLVRTETQTNQDKMAKKNVRFENSATLKEPMATRPKSRIKAHRRVQSMGKKEELFPEIKSNPSEKKLFRIKTEKKIRVLEKGDSLHQNSNVRNTECEDDKPSEKIIKSKSHHRTFSNNRRF